MLLGANSAGGKLFCNYLKDVTTRVSQHDLSGKLEREIALPGLGSAGGFGGKKEDRTLFYTFTSFNYPPAIYHYDIASGDSRLFRKREVKFNPDDYEVKQVFYPSKDGTRVPMFIAHKKGPEARRHQPHAALRLRRLQHPAAALASAPAPRVAGDGRRLRRGQPPRRRRVRRGLAQGRHAGQEAERLRRLHRRRRVADRARSTPAADKLAIPGGRNGGLLVGAVHDAAARPVRRLPARGGRDGHAALPQVHRRPGLDRRLRLLRRRRTQFKSLYAYSPLHNIKPGRELSGDAGHHGRPRRPRGAGPQLQVHRRAAGDAQGATTRC